MDPCPQSTPPFPRYSPGTWWIPPPVSDSSHSDRVPAWVIVGLVAAVVIFLTLLFIFIKKGGAEKPPPAASESSKPAEEPKKSISEMVLLADHHLPMAMPAFTNPVQEPGHCASCGRRGGLYQMTYKCPKCLYKYDVGIHIQYPDKQ